MDSEIANANVHTSALPVPNDQVTSSVSSNGAESTLNAPNSIIHPQRLRHILEEVEPEATVDDNLVEILKLTLEDFVESVVKGAHRIAKHRKSESVQVKDLWMHLKHDWHLSPNSFPPSPSNNSRYFLNFDDSAGNADFIVDELVQLRGNKLKSQFYQLFEEQAKFAADEPRGTMRHRVRSSTLPNLRNLQQEASSRSIGAVHDDTIS